jgi:hypothetical protein
MERSARAPRGLARPSRTGARSTTSSIQQGVEVRKLSRRTTILTIGMALVLATGLVAFAFFTGGTGGGNVTVSGGSTDIVVHQNAVPALTPGATANLAGTVDNNGGSAVTVNQINATFTVNNGQSNPSLPACDADDFTLSGVGTVASNPVPAFSNSTTWSGIQLTLVDKPPANPNGNPNTDPNNQDNCKNATVDLTYTVT